MVLAFAASLNCTFFRIVLQILGDVIILGISLYYRHLICHSVHTSSKSLKKPFLGRFNLIFVKAICVIEIWIGNYYGAISYQNSIDSRIYEIHMPNIKKCTFYAKSLEHTFWVIFTPCTPTSSGLSLCWGSNTYFCRIPYNKS